MEEQVKVMKEEIATKEKGMASKDASLQTLGKAFTITTKDSKALIPRKKYI